MKIETVKNISIPVAFLVIGLTILVWPMILNPDLMPGDTGDARYINYVLEHSFLYLQHNPIHSSFWDLPIFYPNKNTLAYTDILLGGMIIYIPIRFFTDMLTSMQIWLVVLCLLNYISAYILFKNVFKFKTISSSLAAFVFAFGLPRQNQLGHMQFYLEFSSIFSLICLFSLRKDNSKLKNHILWASAVLLFVMQLYTSFYLGWFMVFSFFIGFLVAVYNRELWLKLTDFIKFYKYEIIIYSLLGIALIIPLYLHYTAVGQVFVFHTENFKPKGFLASKSYIDMFFFDKSYFSFSEKMIGFGYLTSLFILAGFYKCKWRKYLLIFFIVLFLSFGVTFIRHIIYELFPGYTAIRETHRIIFILMIFGAYFIALLADTITNKKILYCLIALILIEHIPCNHMYHMTKGEHYKRLSLYKKIDKNCKIITYDIEIEPEWVYQIDIMMYATMNNVYTKNGFSGYIPEISQEEIEGECRFTISEDDKDFFLLKTMTESATNK